MIKFTEYDTLRRDYSIDSNGTVTVKSSEDIEPILKAAKEMRDNERGKSGDFKHYASIPMVIVEQLMKKGINIFDKNCEEDFKREIETNYPYLKTTNLKGW